MEDVDKEKEVKDGNAEDVSVEKTQKVNADQTEGVDVEKMEKVKGENNKQVIVEDVVADEDERILSGKIVHVMPENMDEVVSEKIDVKEDEKVQKAVASSAKQVQDDEMKEVPSSGTNEVDNDIARDASKMKPNNIDKMHKVKGDKMQEAAQDPNMQDVVCNGVSPANVEDDDEMLTEDVARDQDIKTIANAKTDNEKLDNVEDVQASVDMQKPHTKSNEIQNADDDKDKIDMMENKDAPDVVDKSTKRERKHDHDGESSQQLHKKTKLLKRSNSTCAHTEKTEQLPEKVVVKKTTGKSAPKK